MSLFIFMIAIVVCISPIWVSAFELPTSNELNPQLVNALFEVVHKGFPKNHRNFINMRYELEADTKTKSLLDSLLTTLLRKFFGDGSVLEVERTIRFKPFRHNELVLVDTLASLRRVYENLLEWRTRNLSFTIIFIATLNATNEAALIETLELMWQMSILNVGVIVQHQEGSSALMMTNLSMFTYWPFSPDGCKLIRPKVSNHFNPVEGKWISDYFFPDKLSNFHGCPLTCATWEDMPYLAIRYSPAFEEGRRFDGIEGGLLQFFGDTLNASLKLYILNLREIGETFDETGAIFEKEIFSGVADFCLAALLHKPEAHDFGYFSQTEYYFMSHIQLVANVFSAYSAYEKLAYPFKHSFWWLIGLTFAVGCLVIYACNCQRCARRRDFLLGPRNRVPYYNLFILAMGANSAAGLPRRNFARFLLALWLLATYLLRCAYQSGMYELLRNDRHRNPPNTIDSLAAERYIVWLIPGNVRYLASVPQVRRHMVRFLNSSELEAFPALLNASSREAIITPYEYFGHYRKRQPRLSQSLHLVHERIFSQQLSMYVRHNSYMVDVLNRQIKLAQTYGFIQYWKNSQMDESNIDVTGGKVSNRNDRKGGFGGQDGSLSGDHNILSMRELRGIFMIVLWAHLASTLIFLVELLAARIDRWRWRE